MIPLFIYMAYTVICGYIYIVMGPLQMINGFNKKNATVTDLLQRYDFHFLPILNPDGYEYSYEKTAVLYNIQ